MTRLQSEDQLAGVLGHEVGHVIARHSAEQMSKQELSQGIAGAAGVAAGDVNSAYYAQVVANMVNMKYGMINMYIGSMRQPFSMDNGQLSIPNGPPGAKALQIMDPLKTGTAETFPGAGSQRF